MTVDTQQEVEERVHWLPMIAAISSISVVGIAIGLGMPLLSVILETRGHSATMIGFNTAVAGLASIVGAPLATPLAMRFGVAWTMLAMIATGVLAFVGFHFAPDFWMWFPLRVLLHIALTVLFILSEFWISTSAPPHRRGLVLGIYATVLSLGFAAGPWLFAQLGSTGFLPFGVIMALVTLAAIPVLAARNESPTIVSNGETSNFLRYIWLVPTATAAVLVFGAVETGGFALFPVYGNRIGYSEADAALLLTMIGLGNVLLQIPLGMISDRVSDRRYLLLVCATIGLAGTIFMPHFAQDWHLMAALLFVWGGVVAAMYTIGLAHLGSKLSGHDLASANAAFVLCYGVGMVLGPQAIGIGMDLFGPSGFGWALGVFFAFYIALVGARLARKIL
ncbi:MULTISPECIES: MFS transporter [unclassified Mesorhizobium]|uniref:MFS transporter n=1 Tax=unclassified Mesorhizobium TaxID=325217 RepID=UPI000FE6FACC|nr:MULTISPECIES: MFS transporter [unclassified Mesorhizobium]RWB26952.1 MAG: MFS transporter [Mesorhizobium sp.]RWB27780.1 MAG: MFS transporter [Mesorhizobium sp.]RWB56883.1 MAG: MFS transporter [Mesorhizobium sp.]RWC21542.1 MAG: MFS transporter [Mesorhizobium sp.]RWC36048.1 MAG: MFS transporter [Mesorhizobium sp.]